MTALAHPADLAIGLLIVGAALVFDWAALAYLALPAIAAVIIAALTHRPRVPGHAVRPAEEPELTNLVRQVAENLGFRAPLLLRVVADPDAALAQTKSLGARTFTLILGLPLLRRFTAAELAAVVAHELAHQQHAGDRRISWLLGARDSLVQSLDHKIRPPMAVVTRLLRATQAHSWRVELAADAESAAVAGTRAARQALAQFGPLSAAFDLLGEEWAEVLGEDGAYPEDLYEALDAALADPHVARRMTVVADTDEDDPMGMASHPPLAVRLAALPEQPGRGWNDNRPVPLRNADELRRRCLRDLFDFEDDTDKPRPVRILDAEPDRLEARLRKAGERLVEVMGEDSVRGAITAAADTITDGSWPRLARAIEPEIGKLPRPMRSEAGRDVLVGCLGRALSEVFLKAGWTRVSRWTTSVLADPGGDLVDIRQLVEQAIDCNDPSRIRSLLSACVDPVVP